MSASFGTACVLFVFRFQNHNEFEHKSKIQISSKRPCARGRGTLTWPRCALSQVPYCIPVIYISVNITTGGKHLLPGGQIWSCGSVVDFDYPGNSILLHGSKLVPLRVQFRDSPWRNWARGINLSYRVVEFHYRRRKIRLPGRVENFTTGPTM